MADENEDLFGEVDEAEDQIADMVPVDEAEDEEDEELQISEVEEDPEFFENLAEVIPDSELKKIADSFIEKIDRDKQARENRDKQYEEGLRRTGLGNDAPGGASFPGASKAVHPIMIEAGVDFCSRVMREVYPPNGPVKDRIVGDQTQEKLLKAKRKVRHMNWQLTVQCPEFRSELEQTLTQTPMGGNCYLKVWWDEDLKRPSFLMVPVDKLILPFAAASYRSASRRTHVIDMIHDEIVEKQDAGVYRRVELSPALDYPEETRTEKANDKIEGREKTDQNQDGLRSVYEITVPRYNLSCESFEDSFCDGKAAPYVITIDKESREVLAIYRNWDPEDKLRTELEHFVEWTFLPWRGALALGLPHVIGTLSGAATGALRALLDSAHIQNAPTALKLADPMTGGGQTVNVSPTQVSEIGGGTTDDIRKLAMPMPFNPPSSTLMQLLQFLVQEARGVIRTTYQEIADSGATPVGTTMARMEQAMVVFSSICARAHQSMANLFTILHRLNKQNLDDYVTMYETGEILAYRADYEGPVDVVPVSDPNIFSEAQRQAQAITIVQRATGNPMYDAREVEKTFLRAMKVEDPDRFLVKQPEPERLNPVNENVAAAFGRPLAAFPDQDHLAHIQVHLDFMTSPFLGQMPNIAMPVMQGMVEHLKQHVVFWYVTNVYSTVKEALGGVDPTQVMVDDPDTQKKFDQLLAVSSKYVLNAAQQQLEGVPQIIQQAMQMLQSMQPPMPMDPSAVSAMDVKRREAADQAKDQNDKKRLELNETKLAMEAEEKRRKEAMEAAKIAADAQNKDEQAQQRDRHVAAQLEADMAKTEEQLNAQFEVAAMNNESRERMNQQDNATAMSIAAAEIESAENVQVSTGTGLNPGSK